MLLLICAALSSAEINILLSVLYSLSSYLIKIGDKYPLLLDIVWVYRALNEVLAAT